MIHKVAKFIEEKRLLAEGQKVLVAISGGADSVALLIALKKLGYQCEAMHCNFHLRGEESLRDEEFVRKLCSKHCVPLHVINFDTTSYAKEKEISIEMAARELRYNAFEKYIAETGMAGHSLTCPNCGAPITGLGDNRICKDCGTGVTEVFNINVWMFTGVSPVKK